MAQQKKLSRLQGSEQKKKYSFFKPAPVSFPPQKRSSLPGFTSYQSIPPEPQSMVTEIDEPIIAENNNTIII